MSKLHIQKIMTKGGGGGREKRKKANHWNQFCKNEAAEKIGEGAKSEARTASMKEGMDAELGVF